MTAQIINFKEPVAAEEKVVSCSFCGMTIRQDRNKLSNFNDTAHICPKCMVKCAELMDNKSVTVTMTGTSTEGEVK